MISFRFSLCISYPLLFHYEKGFVKSVLVAEKSAYINYLKAEIVSDNLRYRQLSAVSIPTEYYCRYADE